MGEGKWGEDPLLLGTERTKLGKETFLLLFLFLILFLVFFLKRKNVREETRSLMESESKGRKVTSMLALTLRVTPFDEVDDHEAGDVHVDCTGVEVEVGVAGISFS